LDLTRYIKTSYQNTKQFAKIVYIGRQEKKAVITLRIIKNNGCEGYRVVPFVFLPNLDEEETDNLVKCILNKMTAAGVKDSLIDLLKYLQSVPGKRTFNELITLLLSQAVLQNFNDCNNIIDQQPNEDEIRKLARNLSCGHVCGYSTLDSYEEMVRMIVSKKIFSMENLVEPLSALIPENRKLFYTIEDKGKILSDDDIIKIKEKNENYFYDNGIQDEKVAYKLSLNPYYPSKQRSCRFTKGCMFVLRELNDGYTEQEANYSIAFFLQMMDVGIMVLSSCAPNYVTVVGIAQYVKIGEQSLAIMPLRLYEWISLIAKIQRYCRWWGKDFKDEIREYGQSSQCDIESEVIDRIIDFEDKLSQMGQNAEEWDKNPLDKIEFDVAEGKSLKMTQFEFMELQLTHRKKYDDYKGTR